MTKRMIFGAFTVANAPGHGFIGKVCENAFAHEMGKSGPGVVQRRGPVVFYDGVIVGEYTADLIVEDQIIVDPERAAALRDVHVPRCRNDLRTTCKPQCRLISFGRAQVEIRRTTAGA